MDFILYSLYVKIYCEKSTIHIFALSADGVIMLHREDYYDPDTDKKGLTDICVRKNRNGPVGESELYFEKTIMKFTEIKSKSDGTY